MNEINRASYRRFIIVAAMVAACIWMEYYFHVIHGVTIFYTHLFYLPIITASFWWGLKGGLSVSAFLFLIHILFSLPSICMADLARGLMFVFVGATAGILCERHREANEALRSLSALLKDKVKRRTTELEKRALELTTANEALDKEMIRCKRFRSNSAKPCKQGDAPLRDPSQTKE